MELNILEVAWLLRWKLVQWLATWELIVDVCPDLIPESDSRKGFMYTYVFPAELASEVGERLVELIVRGTVRRYLSGSKVSFRTSRTDPTVKMKRKVAWAFTRSALTERDVQLFAALWLYLP